ncbi:hypothetical protein ACTFIV_004116 [Dictyostelium citrinum]
MDLIASRLVNFQLNSKDDSLPYQHVEIQFSDSQLPKLSPKLICCYHSHNLHQSINPSIHQSINQTNNSSVPRLSVCYNSHHYLSSFSSPSTGKTLLSAQQILLQIQIVLALLKLQLFSLPIEGFFKLSTTFKFLQIISNIYHQISSIVSFTDTTTNINNLATIFQRNYHYLHKKIVIVISDHHII